MIQLKDVNPKELIQINDADTKKLIQLKDEFFPETWT